MVRLRRNAPSGGTQVLHRADVVVRPIEVLDGRHRGRLAAQVVRVAIFLCLFVDLAQCFVDHALVVGGLGCTLPVLVPTRHIFIGRTWLVATPWLVIVTGVHILKV